MVPVSCVCNWILASEDRQRLPQRDVAVCWCMLFTCGSWRMFPLHIHMLGAVHLLFVLGFLLPAAAVLSKDNLWHCTAVKCQMAWCHEVALVQPYGHCSPGKVL